MDIKFYFKLWVGFFSYRKKIITSKVESVLAIDFAKLKKEGIELLVFDFDETLTDFHGRLNLDIQKLLQNLLKENFKIAIHSNFSEDRKAELFSHFESFEIFVSAKRNKPNPDGYLDILKNFNLKADKACMVGDRIGTDLFGAFLAGYKKRILVKPFSTFFGGKKLPFHIRLIKLLEHIFT